MCDDKRPAQYQYLGGDKRGPAVIMSCNQISVPEFTKEQIAECQTSCKHASGSKRWCCLFGVWIGPQNRIVISSRKIRPCGGCRQKVKKFIQKGKHIAFGYGNLIRGKEGELAAERIKICQQCFGKRYIGQSLWCQVCKCFIPAKARVPDEKCPKGKW